VVRGLIIQGMPQETQMRNSEHYAYDPVHPLSSLLTVVMQHAPLAPDAVTGEPNPEYVDAGLLQLREVIASWPRTHEHLDITLQRFLELAHHIAGARQAPPGERREKGISLALLQYAANEIPNGFQSLSRLGWTSSKRGLDALFEKLSCLDSVLAAGIGKAAKPKRELPPLEHVLGSPAMTLSGLPVTIKDPEIGNAGFISAHIALPGAAAGRNGGGIKAYTWDPDTSEAMFEEWDSIDSATLWCFERFWARNERGHLGLAPEIQRLTGHDAGIRPVLYIDAIATGEHLKGRHLGLDLVRAAVQRWATPDTLVYAVLHPQLECGAPEGVRGKLEAYAAPLGFVNLQDGVYLQTQAATRMMLAESPLLQPLH